MKRLVTWVLICVVAFFLLLAFGQYYSARNNSEQTALEIVKDFCVEQKLDVHNLTGPVDGRVGNTSKSYSWDYKDKEHHYELLVSFNSFYDPKLAIWDYNRKD